MNKLVAKNREIPLLSFPSYGDQGILSLVRKSVSKALEKDIVTKSAAIAFYSMIAMVPIMVVVLTVFSISVPVPSKLIYSSRLGTSQTVNKMRHEIKRILPSSAFQIVDEQINRVNSGYPITTLSVSIIAALWIASGAFGTICKCMNFIYDRPEQRNYFQLKLLAFGVAILQSSIFFNVLLVFFSWPLIEPWVMLLTDGQLAAKLLEWIVFTLVVLISFSLMLHLGPTGGRHHPLITPGALIATPAFMLGTWGFRLYVQNMSNYNELYGSLGGVMVLMLWFWLYAIILLSGAVVDSVLAEE